MSRYDRYGHLMPGAEQESADRLSAYLGGQSRDENWHPNGTTEESNPEFMGRMG
jgi:hypothetical protein